MPGNTKGKGQGRELSRTNIYLRPEQIAWLKSYASEQGITMAEVVRDAIEFYESLPEEVRNPDPLALQKRVEEAEAMSVQPQHFEEDVLEHIDQRLERLEKLLEEKL